MKLLDVINILWMVENKKFRGVHPFDLPFTQGDEPLKQIGDKISKKNKRKLNKLK